MSAKVSQQLGILLEVRVDQEHQIATAVRSPVIIALWWPKLRARSITRTRSSRSTSPIAPGERVVGRAVVDKHDFVVVGQLGGGTAGATCRTHRGRS